MYSTFLELQHRDNRLSYIARSICMMKKGKIGVEQIEIQANWFSIFLNLNIENYLKTSMYNKCTSPSCFNLQQNPRKNNFSEKFIL